MLYPTELRDHWGTYTKAGGAFTAPLMPIRPIGAGLSPWALKALLIRYLAAPPGAQALDVSDGESEIEVPDADDVDAVTVEGFEDDDLVAARRISL